MLPDESFIQHHFKSHGQLDSNGNVLPGANRAFDESHRARLDGERLLLDASAEAAAREALAGIVLAKAVPRVDLHPNPTGAPL